MPPIAPRQLGREAPPVLLAARVAAIILGNQTFAPAHLLSSYRHHWADLGTVAFPSWLLQQIARIALLHCDAERTEDGNLCDSLRRSPGAVNAEDGGSSPTADGPVNESPAHHLPAGSRHSSGGGAGYSSSHQRTGGEGSG
jgi:hypothetical protein